MDKFCHVCENATVNPNLSPEYDLQYTNIGMDTTSIKGTSLMIRTGDRRATAIVVSQWNKDLNCNEDIAIYKPKFCPECGRPLFENN